MCCGIRRGTLCAIFEHLPVALGLLCVCFRLSCDCLVFAVVVVLARMRFAVASGVEYVVANGVEYREGQYLASGCWLLPGWLLFAVGLVLLRMMFAVGSAVESVTEYVLGDVLDDVVGYVTSCGVAA
jgi:hypothetical protein